MLWVARSSSFRSGAGDEGAADAAHARHEGVRREAAADPRQVLLRHGERRGAPRQPPAGRLGRRADLGVGRRRISQQQGEQLAAAALALALLLALGLRVALDRVGRELVDVGEDRLGEQLELLRVGALAPRRRRDPPPGDARPDPVGGLERVEGPPLAVLGPAQPYIYVASLLAAGRRVADQLDELAERLADARADRHAEGALQRARVLGDLAADRLQDLLGRLGQLGLDRVGQRGRERVPGHRGGLTP